MAAGVGPRAAESVAPHAPAPLVELLGRNALFAPLAVLLRARVAERLARYEFPAGSEVPLFQKGQGGLFIVESGQLAAIVRGARSGATQIVSTLGPPHAIGTSALVLGTAPDVTYVAIRPVVAHRLPGDVFDAVLRQVPEFAAAVARAVAAEAAQFTRHGSIPWADLDKHSFDEQLWACLPSSLTTEARICPLEVDGDTMTVAMVDPRDLAALDLLSAAVPNMRFRVVACSADDLRRLVGTRGSSRRQAVSSSPPAVSSDARSDFRFVSADIGFARDGDKTKTPSSPPPAVSAIEEIVGVGLASGASDIHIEPERQGVMVRYRIDGLLHTPREAFPTELAKGMVIRLKTLARLDMTETRRPQDGRISVQLNSGRLVDLRVSTLPAKFGEKVALRVLDSEGAITDLKTLFVLDQVRNTFTRLLARRTGFLLVTGPTGSGKSTTLYSALNTCRARNINIMTVEDPIEYHLDGVTQVEVHPEAGTTFATVLRALLRQDPNVMLVGEMRDAETARIAVEASLTGHLVMSSLHTNGTLEAIARMRDMGVEPYALANGLLAVLHQRLVQRNCAQCVAPFEYPPFVVETLARHGVLPPTHPTVLMRGTGCARCRNTGMHGRIAVCDMLVINDELREAISRRASLGDLRSVAARSAHVELAQYAGALLRMGLTVPGEVLPLLQYTEG
jgi:type IV pilus assembly protein PilB